MKIIHNSEPYVSATKQWLEEIIIGLNFCPFAKKEFVNNTIYYHVSSHVKRKVALTEIVEQCQFLKANKQIETSLLIYNDGFDEYYAKHFEKNNYLFCMLIQYYFLVFFQALYTL